MRVDQHAKAIAEGDFGRALQSGVTDPTFPQRQTSLIVDPPNGKLPELTAEGKRLVGADEEQLGAAGRNADLGYWVEDFDSWDRCITRGMPSSMMPYRYNNGIEIMQAPGIRGPEHRDDPRGAHHHTVDGRPAVSRRFKQ